MTAIPHTPVYPLDIQYYKVINSGMKRKSDIITFKVDGALAEELAKVPNKSAFIRNAVLAALDSTCPLCQGTGILSPSQQKHWDDFSREHRVLECDDCHELHLVCERSKHSERRLAK